jgi:hypothetical protein
MPPVGLEPTTKGLNDRRLQMIYGRCGDLRFSQFALVTSELVSRGQSTAGVEQSGRVFARLPVSDGREETTAAQGRTDRPACRGEGTCRTLSNRAGLGLLFRARRTLGGLATRRPAAARRSQDLVRFPPLGRSVRAELRSCLRMCGEVEHYSVSTVMREALEHCLAS